ncbi:TPA: lipocalin family protein [Escherichia coli]
MRILPVVAAVTAAFLVVACSSPTPPKGVTVVNNFDAKRYLGTWYEIARFDHRFERGLENKHMTITEFVAQRMRDAQQKGEISPDINTAMTSRLLLDLTYGVLADIEAEDLAREASFAQGLRAMIGGILTAS